MILKEIGQTFLFGQKKFTVGNFAYAYGPPQYELCGVVQEIDTNSLSSLLDFGEEGIRSVSLDDLTPLDMDVSIKTGQRYVLYYLYDGAEGKFSRVLGISESRALLIYQMVEDVKGRAKVCMTMASMDEVHDSLQFLYEGSGPEGNLYLDYAIAPAAVYSKAKGDTNV